MTTAREALVITATSTGKHSDQLLVTYALGLLNYQVAQTFGFDSLAAIPPDADLDREVTGFDDRFAELKEAWGRQRDALDEFFSQLTPLQ